MSDRDAGPGGTLRLPTGPVEPSDLNGEELLSALTTPDETTLRFSGWGFGGRLAPKDSVEFLAWQMCQTTLADGVPEDVRAVFARVQKVFVYGLLDYDLFTVAVSETHLALEGALRVRFVSCYDNEIPLVVDGQPETLRVASFDDVYRYLRDNGRHKRIRFGDAPPRDAPRGYSDLFSWARARGLLAGQRNVGIFGELVDGRNDVAHPERHSVYIPPAVYRLMRDAAEIINHLWGARTPGGRLFPGPIARRPRLVALSAGGAAQTMNFTDLAGEDEGEDRRYTLVLAAEEETLWDHDAASPERTGLAVKPGFQTTDFPAEILHGPCDLAEMRAFISDVDELQGDAVEFQDRVFYVRATYDGLDRPRSAADLIAAKLSAAPGERWYVLRADHPNDAYCAVRDHRPDMTQAAGVELLEEFASVGKAKVRARKQLAA